MLTEIPKKHRNDPRYDGKVEVYARKSFNTFVRLLKITTADQWRHTNEIIYDKFMKVKI